MSSVLLSGRERNKSQLGMFLVVTVTLLLWLWSRSVHHEEYYIQSWGGGWCMPNQSKEAVSPLLCVLMFGARFASDLPNQASWRFEASGKVWEIRFLLLFLLFSEFETKSSAASYLCGCHTGRLCEFIHAFSCARWRHKAESISVDIISESADAV